MVVGSTGNIISNCVTSECGTNRFIAQEVTNCRASVTGAGHGIFANAVSNSAETSVSGKVINCTTATMAITGSDNDGIPAAFEYAYTYGLGQTNLWHPSPQDPNSFGADNGSVTTRTTLNVASLVRVFRVEAVVPLQP